jgi:hypothetical protein
VKVDPERGLPKELEINMDNYSHCQMFDYEKIPFKCKYYHDYKYFSKKPKESRGLVSLKEVFKTL